MLRVARELYVELEDLFHGSSEHQKKVMKEVVEACKLPANILFNDL